MSVQALTEYMVSMMNVSTVHVNFNNISDLLYYTPRVYCREQYCWVSISKNTLVHRICSGASDLVHKFCQGGVSSYFKEV